MWRPSWRRTRIALRVVQEQHGLFLLNECRTGILPHVLLSHSLPPFTQEFLKEGWIGPRWDLKRVGGRGLFELQSKNCELLNSRFRLLWPLQMARKCGEGCATQAWTSFTVLNEIVPTQLEESSCRKLDRLARVVEKASSV